MSEQQAVMAQYAEADDKLFMTLEEAVLLSKELADRVRESDFDVEKIIGVANGALLPSHIVADELNKPIEIVRIRRKGSKIKKRLARFGFIRKFVSALYNNKLTRPALRIVMDRFSALDKTDESNIVSASKPSKILIVDDAIETGQTLQKVIDQHSADGSEIQVAVISWSVAYKNKKAEITPDFVISKRIHHYPWSQNSPHLQDYTKWLESRSLKEWD